MFWRKIFVFIKKDFITWSSYKISFFMHWMGLFISLLTFYFIGKLIGKANIPYLSAYGGRYFPFVLIGVAFSGYLGTALGGFAGGLSTEQRLGTLEAILLSPTKLSTLLLGMCLWNFILSSLDVMVYLLFGGLFFGVDLSGINFITAGVTLLLTLICFGSLGLISAGFILVFKRGNPITWIMSSFSNLLGGTYFPIEVLPKFLRFFSYFIPLTYALKAMRLAILRGVTLEEIFFPEIWVLFLGSSILLPLGIVIFSWGLKRAKRDGSLIHY